jgi:hypothetical protein
LKRKKNEQKTGKMSKYECVEYKRRKAVNERKKEYTQKQVR